MNIRLTAAALLAAAAPYIAASHIKGTATDYRTGEPLPYASVSITGTQTGTLTDDNGLFELEFNTPGRHTVRVSSVGYTTGEATFDIENHNGRSWEENVAANATLV